MYYIAKKVVLFIGIISLCIIVGEICVRLLAVVVKKLYMSLISRMTIEEHAEDRIVTYPLQ